MTASRLNVPRIYSPSLNRPMKPRSAGVKRLPSGQPALLRRHFGLAKVLAMGAVSAASKASHGECQIWIEAVRKRGEYLRLAEQSEILRGFLDSERPEGSKKRTK